jgi:polar amino acid transport system substrate-binding protein
MKRIIRFVTACALLSGVGLLATAAADAQEKSRLDEILARGKVIVGVTSEGPPFGFVDEKGELVGFDIDVAKLVAKGLFGDPTKIEFVRQGSTARWPNVNSGKVDFGIQATTIFPERMLQVAFTRNYIDSGIAVLVKKDSKIIKPGDLNDDKVSVAHLATPVAEERAKRYYPKAKSLVFDSVNAQVTAVRTGRADAAITDLPIVLWYAKQNPDLRALDTIIGSPTNNALFLKPGDFKWWLVLDTMVSEMVGGVTFEDYSDIYRKWFGTEPKHAKYYMSR